MNTVNSTATTAVDINTYTVEYLKQLKDSACVAARDAALEFIRKHGEQGYCGFAWVNIYGVKGSTKLGRAMKAAGYSKDYTGAFQIWNPSGLGTQCMSTKEAGADAAAAVFVAAGFKAYAGGRAD
jgi:hypothetical protein